MSVSQRFALHPLYSQAEDDDNLESSRLYYVRFFFLDCSPLNSSFLFQSATLIIQQSPPIIRKQKNLR